MSKSSHCKPLCSHSKNVLKAVNFSHLHGFSLLYLYITLGDNVYVFHPKPLKCAQKLAHLQQERVHVLVMDTVTGSFCSVQLQVCLRIKSLFCLQSFNKPILRYFKCRTFMLSSYNKELILKKGNCRIYLIYNFTHVNISVNRKCVLLCFDIDVVEKL